MFSPMSTTLYGALSTSRNGLFTNQRALHVTGQNIANENTPGYSRQIAHQASYHNLGGSFVSEVSRVRDIFLDKQRSIHQSALGYSTTRDRALSQLESILDETGTVGMGSLLGELFGAIQDWTERPSGGGEREGVRGAAISLAAHVNSVREQLGDLRSQQDLYINDQIEKINAIAAEIAELNERIAQPRIIGLNINEMMDKRDALVNQLSQYTEVSTYNEIDGPFTVVLANGMSLVEGIHHSRFQGRASEDKGGLTDLWLIREGGLEYNITDQLRTGELAGLIQARDSDILGQIESVDRFAAEITQAFNTIHNQGFNLMDPPTQGHNFFAPLTVFAQPLAANTGAANVTAQTVTLQADLTLDNYEIRVSGGGTTYEVVNLNTGVTSGPQPYTSGAAIDFDGISVTLTGTPADGDVFVINTTTNAGDSFDLATEIKDNLLNLAASADGETGNNEIVLALADLQNQRFMGSGQRTLEEYLNGNLTELGVLVRHSHNDLINHETNLNQVNEFVDSVSGVSIDEESTNLIQFERAYQANARMITKIDELLQTVLQMI